MERIPIDSLVEALSAFRLGYSLFARVEGVETDLVVNDVRGGGLGFQVLVLEGWKYPIDVWAVVSEMKIVTEPPIKQERLWE